MVVLGDESGYTASENQKMKVAAIEAEWHTQPAPASFTVIGIPSMERRETEPALRVPWALGLIATRSLDEQVPGIHELVEANKVRIRRGIAAYAALQAVRTDPQRTPTSAPRSKRLQDDLGFGLLAAALRAPIRRRRTRR